MRQRVARVAAVFLAFALAPRALAQGHDEFAVDKTIEVRVDSPWPRVLNKGWIPVFIELENHGERDRRVEIELKNHWGEDNLITQEVLLPSGGKEALELLAPAHPHAYNAYSLRVKANGADPVSRGSLGAPEGGDPEVHAVLYLCARSPGPGKDEQWTAEISTKIVGGRSSSARIYSLHVAGIPLPTAASASSGASSTNNNMPITAALFTDMPQRSEAYSSLDLVVIDTRYGLPEPARLEPLIAWVKLGGALAMLGPDADRHANAVPALASWMEERFLIRTFTEDEASKVDCYAGGLGTVLVGVSEEVFSTPAQQTAVRWACEGKLGLVPDQAGSRLDGIQLEIPGLGELPYKAFAGLLFLFAALIGPVNFWLVKRRGRPALLLITIPSIALACSLVLLLYGIFYQGIDVKTASHTFTMLDQREHRAATVEKRLLFVGLAPGAGLRPGAGTSCYEVPSEPNLFGMIETSGPVLVDQTDGLLLSGAFLPARTPVTQQIHSERAARGRVEFSRDGERWSVVNGLETGIERLVFRERSGAFHQLDAPIAPGERGELSPISEEHLAGATSLWAQSPIDRERDLAPATYAASIEHNVFGDDCGIESTELAGVHVLWGILGQEGELWR